MKYLWHTSYWDGPLEGMIWFKGWFRWFEMYASEDDDEPLPRDWYRKYYVYKLTCGQVFKECFKHAIFWLWVKKIRIGSRGFYWLFPPRGVGRYKTMPIIGEVVTR